MTDERSPMEVVTLRRARTGADLWPAIEAGQYGRIVQHDEPAAPGQVGPSAAFLEALAEVIERWEDVRPGAQSALIEKLHARLAALEEAGLHVHWGLLERTLVGSGGRSTPIPVAVLRIGGSAEEVVQVSLPAALTAENGNP